MRLNGYEIASLKEIKVWEKQKHKGFKGKIFDLISGPMDYVIKKIGPETMEKLENAVEATVKKLVYASSYTVNIEALLKKAHAHGLKIKDLSELKKCALALLDHCNRESIHFHEKAGAIQGAITGLGGDLVAIGDLTAILIQVFYMIQEIAFCYGYDPNDIIEKEIILKTILGATGSSEAKFNALKDIESFKKLADKKGRENLSQKSVSTLGANALEGYIEEFTVSLLVELIPRALPLISVAVSAQADHEIIKNSGEMAFMVYRRRFIERKRGL